jgi:hypothetical protein
LLTDAGVTPRQRQQHRDVRACGQWRRWRDRRR